MQTSNDPALFDWPQQHPRVGRVTFESSHNISIADEPSASFRNSEPFLDCPIVLSAITSYPWREHAEREIAKAKAAGIAIIIADDDAYPATLKNIPDPPLFLYVKGDLHQGDGIAIVCTRKQTQDGLTVTSRISSELASAGLTIVSGLARGIDTQAHRGALSAGGRTIAVLGCGIDVAYPPENKDLQEEISHSGAVVTENLWRAANPATSRPGTASSADCARHGDRRSRRGQQVAHRQNMQRAGQKALCRARQHRP
jgi:DNA processing protein